MWVDRVGEVGNGGRNEWTMKCVRRKIGVRHSGFCSENLSLELVVFTLSFLVRCYNHILIHYNLLAASLARLKIITDPKCPDLDHTVWQCPIYDTKRLDLIKELTTCTITIDYVYI